MRSTSQLCTKARHGSAALLVKMRIQRLSCDARGFLKRECEVSSLSTSSISRRTIRTLHQIQVCCKTDFRRAAMPRSPSERVPYEAIVDRPPLKLPGDARLAVWLIVNVENWE